ncbi:hypothetical protein JNW88_17060 [Micromonospora sp. ATA32]|nr:hypothetical protein [Micromonospora sp. ATA32]
MTTDLLAPTAGWCPPGGCPVRVAEQLEVAVTLAFQQGRAYERGELAAMEATWKPFARKTYEEAVAARIEALPGKTPPPPLRFDDPDWPPVAIPGAGVRLGPGQIILLETAA